MKKAFLLFVSAGITVAQGPPAIPLAEPEPGDPADQVEGVTPEIEPLPKPTAAALRELLSGLSSDSFDIRERTHVALERYSKEHPQALREALALDYVQAVDPELKHRLGEAMYEAVVDSMDHSGFLGIIMRQGFVDELPCILVDDVLPHSAASRAGLRPGDHILQVDDLKFDPLPLRNGQQVRLFGATTPTLTKFKEYISGRKRGTPVDLKVQRGIAEGARILNLNVRLGRRTRDIMELSEPIELEKQERYFDQWIRRQAMEASTTLPEQGAAQP